QQIGIFAMIREEGDADARSNVEEMLLQNERRLQRLEDFPRDQGDILHVGHRGEQNGEFISAEAGNRVRLPQRPPQALSHLLQQGVSMMMTEGIVDIFKTVQVHQEKGERAALAMTGEDRLLQAVIEKGPVGK